jgi:hypothetical protein
MFESGSNLIKLHMKKVEFHIPFKSANFTVFRISAFKNLWDCTISRLNIIMYEGMGLAFNQKHQALYVHIVGGVDC